MPPGYLQDLCKLLEDPDYLLPIDDRQDISLIETDHSSFNLAPYSPEHRFSTSTLDEILLLNEASSLLIDCNEAEDKSQRILSHGTTNISSTVSAKASPLATPQPPSCIPRIPLPSSARLTNTLESVSSFPSRSGVQSYQSHTDQPYLNNMTTSIISGAISPSTATTLPTRNNDEVIADLRRRHPTQSEAPTVQQVTSTSRSEASGYLQSALEDISPKRLAAEEEQTIHGEERHDEYEEGTDSEDALPTSRPRKITERKRKLNDIADKHMQETTQKLLKMENLIRPGDEGNQSARWLVNQAESRQIIATPREYQTELFEQAKENNIIAVLDTGINFTIISVSLLTCSRIW